MQGVRRGRWAPCARPLTLPSESTALRICVGSDTRLAATWAAAEAEALMLSTSGVMSWALANAARPRARGMRVEERILDERRVLKKGAKED